MTKIISFTVGLLLGFVLGGVLRANAASYDTGWLDADVFASAGTGVAFSNPSNAQTSNNANAQSTISDVNYLTQFLRATDFDAVIPSGKVIEGFQVRFERRQGVSTQGAQVQDYQIQIVGSCDGTSFNYAGQTWPASDAYQVYGSPYYDWDLDCTIDDVMATDFGWGVRAYFYDNGCASYPCSARALVDHMQMKIYYKDPPQIFRQWFLAPFVLGAFASTTCEFVTNGATTTATCADGVITNPTQDVFSGFLLFFIVFGGMVFAAFKIWK